VCVRERERDFEEDEEEKETIDDSSKYESLERKRNNDRENAGEEDP